MDLPLVQSYSSLNDPTGLHLTTYYFERRYIFAKNYKKATGGFLQQREVRSILEKHPVIVSFVKVYIVYVIL